ncbi:hypothetical protein V2K54_12090 [Pseudomonas alliivorans]|nr:hypothetical protein [Pseudomonas alliivorans]MEE4908294.1 hypothetical protein [Pseudomonas alliivorans]MEE4957594.1 hypothetical protein [Pseudomonas alliivorans]MEE4966879.1 hypothetical protein [Pseudomonas alliivorans]MEE5008697.1 hypothetical protein [Pseudomonas alliivorans]
MFRYPHYVGRILPDFTSAFALPGRRPTTAKGNRSDESAPRRSTRQLDAPI